MRHALLALLALFVCHCTLACSAPREDVTVDSRPLPEPAPAALRAVRDENEATPERESAVADRLNRIRGALFGCDPSALEPEQRTRVDVLRGLIEEAANALREGRIDAATSLADKADTICADLFPDVARVR